MKNNILFGILLTLLTNKKTTARELSYKYEMSVRSIYRYIDTLNEANVPIVTFCGPSGGISLADNYKLDKTYFSEKEYSQILTALKSFFEVTNSSETQLILDKFAAMSETPDSQFILKSDQLFINSPISSNIAHKITTFEKAIYEQKETLITYHSRKGEITERIVLPHAFVVNDGQWYIYAFCRFRQDFRLFKISRVYSMILTENVFERMALPNEPKNMEDLAVHFKTIEISLLVDEKSRLDVEEWLGIENVTKSYDGFYAQTKQLFNQELVSKLMSFGDGIRILSPQSLIEKVKQSLKEAISIYEAVT